MASGGCGRENNVMIQTCIWVKTWPKDKKKKKKKRSSGDGKYGELLSKGRKRDSKGTNKNGSRMVVVTSQPCRL